jgi:integrase
MAEKLSDKLARSAEAPPAGYRIINDEAVKGFGLRVTAAGAKAFILGYRRRPDGLQRRHTIGSFPDWSTAGARDEARRLKRAIDGGADPVGELREARSAATVNDLCDRFIADYIPRKRPRTQRDYKGAIAHHIRPPLGRHKVEAVTFSDVDTWHHKTTAVAPVQANRALAILSVMFGMATRWGMRTGANPCRGVERNQEHKRKRYLSAAELARLTAALDKLADRDAADVLRLLLLTGARRGETLAAKWSDFDLDAGTWVKPGATTKQKTDHVVPLSAAAIQLLAGRTPKTEWVFPGRKGKHRRDLALSWRRVCHDAGIAGLRIHDLRHSYASHLASSGVGLPIIGALLGHTQPQTTQRYAHLIDDALRQATEKVSAIVTSGAQR